MDKFFSTKPKIDATSGSRSSGARKESLEERNKRLAENLDLLKKCETLEDARTLVANGLPILTRISPGWINKGLSILLTRNVESARGLSAVPSYLVVVQPTRKLSRVNAYLPDQLGHIRMVSLLDGTPLEISNPAACARSTILSQARRASRRGTRLFRPPPCTSTAA